MRHLRVIAALGAAMAALGAAEAGTPSGNVDGNGWSGQDLIVLASLHLGELPAAPGDRSNAWQESGLAASLGRQLFFDPRFSRNQDVSCGSCHDPARLFQDGRAVAEGTGVGVRRSMPIVGAGHNPQLLWDGRKDSLWSQALGPLEDPLEHGSNRMRIARLLHGHYGASYAALFGAIPDLAALPDDASPLGTPGEQAAWLAMEPSARDAVSRMFANMGKAIAAYEQTLKHQPSRLDRFIEQALGGEAGETPALTPQEVRGLRLFIGKGECVGCHSGPSLADQHFHNTGVPQRSAGQPDRGRATGIARLQNDEFNCLGRYSDAVPADCRQWQPAAEGSADAEGAFRTPSLRGVALRPPYMHAGQITSLEKVVRHYIDAPRATTGNSVLGRSSWGRSNAAREEGKPSAIRLSAAEQRDLVAFLRAL